MLKYCILLGWISLEKFLWIEQLEQKKLKKLQAVSLLCVTYYIVVFWLVRLVGSLANQNPCCKHIVVF